MKTIRTIVGAMALVLVAAGCKTPQEMNKFYTLTNDNGMSVVVTNFGARLSSINIPDKDGVVRDVLLGFDKVEDYYPENNPNAYGATIGRYANRIGNAKFTIDGVEYNLPKNNNGHCLHGGDGWKDKSFTVVEVDNKHIKMQIESPDGDNGFPGNVTASVTFTLTDDNKVDIEYEAVTDAPTVINMTNHAYFNLSGDPGNNPVTDNIVYVNAAGFAPADATLIPTGEIWPVKGTPMDFTTPHPVGDFIDCNEYEQISNGHGYDHSWALDTKGDVNTLAARCICPQTGITLDVYTDEPAVQIYTGDFGPGTPGKGGANYKGRASICFETQHFPDTPNKPQWPSALLRPGEKYTSHTIYAFSITEQQ